MLKFVLPIFLFCSSAFAGEIRAVNTFVVEDKERISQEYDFRGSFGLRLETDFHGHNYGYLLPRLRIGAGLWDIGPEVRVPVYGKKYGHIKDYTFLLKSEMKTPF